MLLKNLIVLLLVVPLVAFAKPQTTAELEIAKSQHIKVYAFEQVLNRWGDEQWASFDDLVDKEGHWNNEAQNPHSTAYGIGQFLDSTWKSVGCKKTSDPEKQIDCMIDYIELRYGTPQKALSYHKKNNWY